MEDPQLIIGANDPYGAQPGGRGADALVERAKALLAERRLAEAAALFSRAIEIEPEFFWAHYGLGEVLSDLERWDAAAAAFQRAIGLRSDVGWAHYRLGIALSRLERWEEAAGAYGMAIESLPDEAWAHHQLGDALTQLERWEAAHAAYQRAIDLQPGNAASHNNLANVHLRLRHWPEAVAAFTDAIAQAPQDCWTYNNLGEALFQLGRWEEAAAAYQEAIRRRPDFSWPPGALPDTTSGVVEDLGNLPDVSWSDDELRETLSIAERWEEADVPRAHAGADEEEAEALCRFRYWEEARVAYQRVIGIEPDNVGAYTSLGRVLMKLARWEEAVSTYQRAVALNPDTCRAYDGLGHALSRTARWEEAAHAYRQAIKLNPAVLWSHLSLGMALGGLGNPKAAVACLRRAIDRGAEAHRSYQRLGDRLAGLDRREEAADAYRRGVDIARDPHACIELGRILEVSGHVEHAISAYTRAIVVDPRCRQAYTHLGRLLERHGRSEDASAVYDQAGASGDADDVMPRSDRHRASLEGRLHIARAANDLVFAEDGQRYIDLFCGSGTVFLGHAHPEIAAAVHDQLSKVWITGVVPTRVRSEAETLVERFFPPTHRLAGLYSTGMEAAEFALRLARVATRRRGAVGFERCMHGKSTATACLAWPSDYVRLADWSRIPYVGQWSEARILERLATVLASETVSAVFVEPLQGSGGGHLASPGFFQEVARLCAAHGSLLAVDEILTGFHRTGDPFLHQTLGVTPDIVLIGKAMGNGFPVSGVVVDRTIDITPEMLPGSTFSGNPLAAAAVAATLSQMQNLPLRSAVAQIGDVIATTLNPLKDAGVALRGLGAMWVLEFPPDVNVTDVAERILRAGVVVSVVGCYIRLLPPATIPQDHLVRACTAVRDAGLAVCGGDAS